MRPEIEQAVKLMQRRDPQSLEEALALLQNTVFSFSMKVCGQRADAEDTMQEVLVQSVPNLPKFSSPQALMVWLYKVARSRCLMSRRKSKFTPKQALSLDQLMPDQRELGRLSSGSENNPESGLSRKESARRLREAVQQLPPEYRIILVLHDMEELSDSDIAEITGLRPGTIRVRLHRARLFVRKELARSDVPGARPVPPKRDAATPAQRRDGRCKELFAELSSYLDEVLDNSLCEELEKHLQGCAPCQAFLSSLEKSIDLCRAVPDEKPDPALAARLRRELLAEYQRIMATAIRSEGTS